MRLADYLAKHSIKRTDFAGLIGVSQSYITQLCQDQIWPGRDIIGRIAKETGGEVTANDFMAAEAIVPASQHVEAAE